MQENHVIAYFKSEKQNAYLKLSPLIMPDEKDKVHIINHTKSLFSILPSFSEQTQIATSFSIFYLGLICQNVSEKVVLLVIATRNIIHFVSSNNG